MAPGAAAGTGAPPGPRSPSPPLEARREAGFADEAEMERCTPRCEGLAAPAAPPVPAEVGAPGAPVWGAPAMLRNESDEPDLEPSDSGYKTNHISRY